MAHLFFDAAMTPQGWARNVRVSIAGGLITGVATDAVRGEADYGGAIALPGLASLHSHTFQRGMAGLAEVRGPANDSFWTWRQVMYRFLGVLKPEDVEAVAAFAFMEMVERGFTTVGEFHYLHHGPDGVPYADLSELSGRIIAAAGDSGIGLTLLPVLYMHGGFGGVAPVAGQRRFLNPLERYLRLVEDARRMAGGLPGTVVGIAPHSLRAVAPEDLARLLASTPEGPVHIHIAEQRREVEDCLTWSGQRPVEWLLSHQSVDHRWCLIHATHMTDAEAVGVARAGAVAGLCPLTEANLGDGTFNLATFRDAGGSYGVGTDSNIEITAPGELKQLEYSQRLAHLARNVAPQAEGQSSGGALYRAALTGGAQALQQPGGALAPGCRADFVVLDGAHPDLCAVSDDRWLDSYTFVAGASAIESVYVAGTKMVENGRHRARERISRRYQQVMRRIAAEL